MPGGLLQLVAYGQANIILNGNPSKTFFNAVEYLPNLITLNSLISLNNLNRKVSLTPEINKGKIVAIIYGKAKGILKSERVALNFLSLISGVATITKKFVDKVRGKSCKICCTRKTSPNLRLIQKYGVKLGGGLNHRFNLSDEILIKDNHIAVDGNIRELVKRAIKNKKGKKITVEVDNLSQFKKIIFLVIDLQHNFKIILTPLSNILKNWISIIGKILWILEFKLV